MTTAPLPFGPRRIYLAASWQNPAQPDVVARLRAEGHEVYDFRNPAPGVTGFSWRKILDTPPPWSAEETMRVLEHPAAEAGFAADYEAMQWADTCVMLQPSGRSAALELGWAAGAGKLALVLLVDGQEPELMLKVAGLYTSLDDVLDALRRYDPVARAFLPTPADAVRANILDALRAAVPAPVSCGADWYVTPPWRRRGASLLKVDAEHPAVAAAPPEPATPPPERTCRGCRYSGFDPDGPYCVNPVVDGDRGGLGVSLASRRVAELCPHPEHPHWEAKPAANDPTEAAKAALAPLPPRV